MCKLKNKHVGAGLVSTQPLQRHTKNNVGFAWHANQQGITLIALVITIIVLLILAGVTINLALGENGIFKLAKQATENYVNAQDKELADMQNFNNEVSNVIGNMPSGNISSGNGASGGETTPEPPPARQAGGYDADGNLVVSWESLVNDYGMDASKNYTNSNHSTEATSPTYVLDRFASIREIVIPENITNIGNYAFGDCNYITSITINEGVTNIGEYAFSFSKELTDVTICGRLNNIGKGGFYACPKLKNVSICGVKVVGEDTFNNCTNLINITFQEAITTDIGQMAFNRCTSLTSISLPNSVTTIGDNIFDGCTNLANVTIPDNITSIPYAAFRSCTSLRSITIPSGVTSIGLYAFQDCTGFDSLTIPATVTTISSDAFKNVKHVYYNGPAASSNNWGALAFN